MKMTFVAGEIDKEKVKHTQKTVEELKENAEYTNLNKALTNEEIKARLMKSFNSEPIDSYLTAIMVDGVHLNLKEALNIDLTEYVYLDFLYRWLNHEDISINITGRPGKGKSNILLNLYKKWVTITGRAFRLDNVVFYSPLYNLLLKGYKVKDRGDHIELKEFKLEKGEAICLDEASDTTIAGPLSMTMLLQSQDIEARMRALQVGRFSAGTREIQHQSYYNIWVIERDPIAKTCTGVVYAKESNDAGAPIHYLGYTKVPYIDFRIFEAYNKPKIESIYGYGSGSGTNLIAKTIKTFANELKADKEYQSLPLKPSISRVNWLQSNPRYSIFNTVGYFNDLEKLSRPLIQETNEKKIKDREVQIKILRKKASFS